MTNDPKLTEQQRLYAEEEKTIKSYMKARGAYGNLFQSADVMLANMPNTAVCRSRLALSRNNETMNMSKADRNKIVKQFFDKISEILDENKCPISLLIPGHYRTIVGIKGGKLQVRDSQDNDNAKITELTVERFRYLWDHSSNDSQSLELVYLKKIDGDKELERKYGYSYDEAGKLSYTAKDEQHNAITQENLIHNLGMRYESRNNQKKRYIDLFIEDEIYVPKNLNNVQNVKDELAKYDKYCNELKVDSKNTTAEAADINYYNQEVYQKRKGSDTMYVNYGIVDGSVTKRLEEERDIREKKRKEAEQQKEETLKKKQEEQKKKEALKKQQEQEQKKKAEALKYAGAFKEKSYTVSEREAKLFNEKSRLYVKRTLYETLIANSKKTADEIIDSKRKIALANRIATGVKALDSLCAFMGDDVETNNSLAQRYADKNKRFEALDTITLKLMETDINVKATTDEEFAKAAADMELISRRARAYKALLEANPEYEKRLMNRAPGSGSSDLETVSMRLNNMLAISDYYRARKALMSDSYYILHYNDEISANKDTASTADQRRVSDLINLVAQCAVRLEQKEYRTREDADIERVLARAEAESRKSAYLTGRPDLKKADPDTVHKHNTEIEKYLKAAGIGLYTSREKIADTDDKIPYPKAEKYRTEAAKNYFDAVKFHMRMAIPGKYADKLLPPDRVGLLKKLYALFKNSKGEKVSKPEFRDPKTNEVWHFATEIQRMPLFICALYAGDMSNEEVLDAFEGLLVTYREDIDLTKEDQRLYARERFLDSLQKIFRMQYENMKRYQNTYGTLADDLPFGSFMESLGSGQSELAMRNMFGQDFSQLVSPKGERKSQSDGKNYTIAEILLKYDRISKEELDDAVRLCPDYYQNLSADQSNRFMDFRDYDREANVAPGHMDRRNAEERQYSRDHKAIGGPSVSQAESRNIWKKALKYTSDINVTGSDSFLLFQKNKLDLYTSAEKKAMKEQRKRDAGILSSYNNYLDECKEALLKETRGALGIQKDDKAYDGILEKLIVFHPGMLDSGKVFDTKKKKRIKGIDEYYELVRKYTGIGISGDEDKSKAKREALDSMTKLWSDTFKYSANASDPEDLMTGGLPGYEKENARKHASDIMSHSKLMVGEVRHRMFETIQSLAAEPGTMDMLKEETRNNLAGCAKEQLAQEIYRTILKHDFYLKLKDIGSKRQTDDERMYQELLRYGRNIADIKSTLDEFIGDQDFINAMAHFGIQTKGVLIFSKTAMAKSSDITK